MATREGRSARGAASRKKKSKKGRPGFIRRLIRTFVTLSIIGAASLTAVVAYYGSRLPPTADWTVPKRAANVRILAADGTLITNRGDSSGQSLTLDEMPPYLPEAVIAIEDRRFYWHFGIDPIGLARAAFVNFTSGGVVQGGSTLTQQLAKNLFLTPDRTFERKVQEVIMAVWLEARLTKKQILELYLNRVYLGAGAYGVDAAAHRYFGKSARNVNLAEAATLAALLKAPTNYSPILHPQASEARAQQVLAAMREAGFIGDREATLALSTEVKAVRDVAGGSGRYVADWVMDLLPNYIGSVDQDIIVDTTIDMHMQSAAARAIDDVLDVDGARFGASQAALVAIDPDGGVKALVGGRDYGTSPFNRAVDGRRQPGSSFKPFVYLTALEDGMIPETVRVDQPVSISGWRPQNFSKDYKGPVTLLTALSQSLNTVSAQLTAEVGPSAVVSTARRLGIKSPLLATPSIALGTSEVTPLEMTAAFVPFSNGGRGVIAHVIDRIMTSNGDTLYARSGSGPGQVINPAYVGMMNAMLQATVTSGTGRKAQIPGWQVAGKTGTSQDFRDAWFIGYTGALTAGVWFGNDDNRPTKKASGSNLPSIAWSRFMSQALQGVAVADLPGRYRFHDPSNYALVNGQGPTPPGSIASLSRGDPIGDALAQADQDGWMDQPSPDGAPGAAPQKERGFFQRLFGG